MNITDASRKNTKIKMAIQGPAGSGKTMSALKIAFGLCNDWSKIVVVDTENRSSELYAHLGKFKVIQFPSPFTPERYVEAIQLCERNQMQVIIIDSISHEWEGIGGVLEQHAKMTGNSYTNWSKLTPRHNYFVQYMLQSPIHIIGTIRSKQEYVLNEKNGKQVPEKVGMKGLTRSGMDYEFTLVFELDIKHNAISTKDRTSLFIDKHEGILDENAGIAILQWCNEGEPITPIPANELSQRVNECLTINELLQLYLNNPPADNTIQELFSKRRTELEQINLQTNHH